MKTGPFSQLPIALLRKAASRDELPLLFSGSPVDSHNKVNAQRSKLFNRSPTSHIAPAKGNNSQQVLVGGVEKVVLQ